jgi:hypothetical protein
MENLEDLRAMRDTISDTYCLNKIILSRNKKLSRLLTDRCRVNCETCETTTPDLSVWDREYNFILFL